MGEAERALHGAGCERRGNAAEHAEHGDAGTGSTTEHRGGEIRIGETTERRD